MSYKYRNVKTKEVITTTNRVSGKNWELVEDDAKQPDMTDTRPEDSEEMGVVEEIPKEPKKASRRGKK